MSKKTHKSCFKILDTCRVIGHHAYIAFHVSVIKKQEFDFLWYQIRQQQAKFWHCSNMELHHWIPCFENLLALLCLGYNIVKLLWMIFKIGLTYQKWIKKLSYLFICDSYKNELVVYMAATANFFNHITGVPPLLPQLPSLSIIQVWQPWYKNWNMNKLKTLTWRKVLFIFFYFLFSTVL